LEQEIMLKAFVYEEQSTYKVKDTYQKGEEGQENIDRLKQGNITKKIKVLNSYEAKSIKWAFKLSSYDKISLNSTLTKDDKGFVKLKQRGQSFKFTVKELFKEDARLESLVGKTVTFFAYDEALGINTNEAQSKKAYKIYDSALNQTRKEVKIGIDNAYAQYRVSNYKDDWNKRQIQADRIISVTLKIIQTRFRLEFDGQMLAFLENERVIKQWEARSGEALMNLKEDLQE
ncbi:hypothetical protein, partial [Campylobacter troglodytis]|uniref:hypothetical protein n=1 Tax=Campylobacter troglodytis TaxID=654363 RepID=UPI00163BC34C